MFNKKHRLAKDTEVKATFAHGRSFFSPFFSLRFFKKPGALLPRFTVIVSTKVSKKAVSRNRLKRIVREELKKNIPVFRPGDCIVSVKPAALKLTGAELRDALKKLLTQARLTL